MRLWLPICALLCLVTIDAHGSEKQSFDSVEVRLMLDNQANLVQPPKSKKVVGSKQVAKFAAYFPQMGLKKKGARPAGWKAAAELLFKAKGKQPVKVFVNYKFDTWSESGSYGDWSLKPGLWKELQQTFGIKS